MIFPSRVVEYNYRDLQFKEVQGRILNLSPEQEICIFFDGDEIEFSAFLFTLKETFSHLTFALKLTRRLRVKYFCSQLPFWILTQLYLVPVRFDVHNPETLTCAEIKKIVSYFLEVGALAKPLPYRDFELEDESVPIEIRWESHARELPELSVIIPTRNYEKFLPNVIRHLLEQSLSAERYEIIVVDDGGDDNSLELLKLILGPVSGKIHFKYLYAARGYGTEHDFRAGLCRNWGVKHSRGTYLLFLDSDMIVRPDFLERLLEEMNRHDVIQCPRWHIVPEKSRTETRIEDLSAGDFYLEEPKYWGPFFESSLWSEIPFGWRYTCTYCLAVKADAFKQIGGFRGVFKSYGFEDTELGYRLFKAGYRFHLWKERVFHLTFPKEKSRYYNSILRKQILLSVTGKVFFLSTLDLEVFSLFGIYMGGESRWTQRFYEYSRRLCQKIIGRRDSRLLARNSVER